MQHQLYRDDQSNFFAVEMWSKLKSVKLINNNNSETKLNSSQFNWVTHWAGCVSKQPPGQGGNNHP